MQNNLTAKWLTLRDKIKKSTETLKRDLKFVRRKRREKRQKILQTDNSKQWPNWLVCLLRLLSVIFLNLRHQILNGICSEKSNSGLPMSLMLITPAPHFSYRHISHSPTAIIKYTCCQGWFQGHSLDQWSLRPPPGQRPLVFETKAKITK